VTYTAAIVNIANKNRLLDDKCYFFSRLAFN